MKATLDSGLRLVGDADCVRLAGRSRQVKAISHKQSCVLYNCVNLPRHVSADERKAFIRRDYNYD